jgi:hypothetical protein
MGRKLSWRGAIVLWLGRPQNFVCEMHTALIPTSRNWNLHGGINIHSFGLCPWFLAQRFKNAWNFWNDRRGLLLFTMRPVPWYLNLTQGRGCLCQHNKNVDTLLDTGINHMVEPIPHRNWGMIDLAFSWVLLIIPMNYQIWIHGDPKTTTWCLCWLALCCSSKIPDVGCFIKKRGLFSTQFQGLKVQDQAFISGQSLVEPLAVHNMMDGIPAWEHMSKQQAAYVEEITWQEGK